MSNVAAAKRGWRDRLGLGTNQEIPLSDLQNLLPPPPGLPTPKPHLRAGLPVIAGCCIFVFPPFIYAGLYHNGGMSIPLTEVICTLLVILGLALIVLVWGRWNVQKRAIQDGTQVMVTVTNAYSTGGSGRYSGWPAYHLEAQWTGNDGTTYRFHTLTGSTAYTVNQPWQGKRVRLYIDRDNPQRYYLDDMPIPEQVPSDQPSPPFVDPVTAAYAGTGLVPPTTVSSFFRNTYTVYAKMGYWKWIVLALVIALVYSLVMPLILNLFNH